MLGFGNIALKTPWHKNAPWVVNLSTVFDDNQDIDILMTLIINSYSVHVENFHLDKTNPTMNLWPSSTSWLQ